MEMQNGLNRYWMIGIKLSVLLQLKFEVRLASLFDLKVSYCQKV